MKALLLMVLVARALLELPPMAVAAWAPKGVPLVAHLSAHPLQARIVSQRSDWNIWRVKKIWKTVCLGVNGPTEVCRSLTVIGLIHTYIAGLFIFPSGVAKAEYENFLRGGTNDDLASTTMSFQGGKSPSP